MNILITGCKGFVGKNLKSHLIQNSDYKIHEYNREDSIEVLKEKISACDVIFHLAGENRTEDELNFEKNNFELAKEISALLISNTNDKKHLIFSSTTQAELDNPYGRSKLKAENEFISICKKNSNHRVSIFRFPGIFGKWCKPNYNSVVATFCDSIANNKPITIHDANKELELVYIDDVIRQLINEMHQDASESFFIDVQFVNKISIGELAEKLKYFANSRESLFIDNVGNGIEKSLYSTFISYLPNQKFVYDLKLNQDDRGVFVEYLKNHQVGQLSYLTSKPGVTRGNHFHHTKIEKFLVINGTASFKFISLDSEERFEIETSGDKPQIVESIPGWAHYIKNIGEEDMIVILWANEIYDKENPDTYFHEVENE
jgi:UDP-2-acetamido-2,6-beta-L-arabino-hexul-4-ose reductase